MAFTTFWNSQPVSEKICETCLSFSMLYWVASYLVSALEQSGTQFVLSKNLGGKNNAFALNQFKYLSATRPVYNST